MPFCVIAAEKESAELIKQNLIKTGLYPDWEFQVCTSARDLYAFSPDRPGVVVVSRFLPGEDTRVLLQRLPLLFSASHIVLLAGNLDEKGKAFVRAARQAGLNNIVTGKLPGDRPYNLLAALRYAREDDELSALMSGEEEIGPPGLEVEEREEYVPEPPAAAPPVDTAYKERPRPHPPQPAGPQAFSLVERQEHRRDADYLDELLGRYAGPPGPAGGSPTDPAFERPAARAFPAKPVQEARVYPRTGGRGVFVLTAANKGGVGKTTVAVTLAVALARAGIPVVLWDLDFGAPDVASFFDISGVAGIEALAKGLFRPEIAEGLLVKAEENLYVLPGPMDRTVPAFEPGEIGAIAQQLLSRFPVVFGDTPPEFWTKPWLEGVFPLADRVLAVVDQSKFSEQETAAYAPCLLAMGVTPEKISIVLNRFSPKLHNAKGVEKHFCSGFKKEVPAKLLPKVAAVIPEEWEAYVQRGYKGEVVGLDDAYSQWHALAGEIAASAGYTYRKPEGEKKAFFRFFGRRKK
ncbi:Iron-sulfur cluster carrier protein [Neomoorella glycerini]|uniref:Iron-sulfur cluster carrier protein n=1 Tax=Neomoorella glycerini TaxID=55779 RepID=A0A6I5ZTY1_9FIRM|nr:P-loop NTPase [Moorella glycerini]QGP93380.1 Iron-sulfur cluster carrier protein [Moorella glycerini]